MAKMPRNMSTTPMAFSIFIDSLKMKTEDKITNPKVALIKEYAVPSSSFVSVAIQHIEAINANPKPIMIYGSKSIVSIFKSNLCHSFGRLLNELILYFSTTCEITVKITVNNGKISFILPLYGKF